MVIIRLKWGQTEYKGRLISVDSYMNVQLSGTEEYIDGKSTGSLGQVLIRFVSYLSLFTSNGGCFGGGKDERDWQAEKIFEEGESRKWEAQNAGGGSNTCKSPFKLFF